MVLVAFPLLALTLTRNAMAIAGVVVAGRLAAVFVGLPVGALTDRVNRRRLVLGVESLRALVMAAFGAVVLTGHNSLVAIYIASFLLGGLTVALDVIASACLPSIVGPEDLIGANAKLMTAELTGEELVGQAAGGAAFSVAAALPFIADAASFVASAVLLGWAVPDNERRNQDSSLLSDIALGLRWLAANRLLRTLAVVIGCLAFCQAMVFGVLALYATGPLRLSAAGYGFFLAVAGSGNIVGTLAARRVHRRIGGGWCVLGAGAVAITGYVVMALTSLVPLAAAALTAETAAVVLGNVAVRGMRQSAAGEEMQGRAASAFQVLVLTAIPLGGLTGGAVAGILGIRGVMAAAAGLQAVVLVVMGTALLSRTGAGRAPGTADPAVPAVPGVPTVRGVKAASREA